MLSKILFLFSLSFIKTIYFNFHYLPFKQAIKLPIILRHVRFKSLKGKVIIDSDHIYTNMIKFGFKSANYWRPNDYTTLDLRQGTMILKTNFILRECAHIRLENDAILKFGSNFDAATNLNIWCMKSIAFGDNVHIGWDVTIMDTNENI